jgi:hypothetical protein
MHYRIDRYVATTSIVHFAHQWCSAIGNGPPPPPPPTYNYNSQNGYLPSLLCAARGFAYVSKKGGGRGANPNSTSVGIY